MMSTATQTSQKQAKQKLGSSADRQKKLPKVLTFLFASEGLKERNIPNKDGKAFLVDDFLKCEHFSQYEKEDFNAVLPTGNFKLKVVKGEGTYVEYIADNMPTLPDVATSSKSDKSSDKSPTKSQPADKSATKSQPADKSATKLQSADKSATKSQPADKSATKSQPADKSSCEDQVVVDLQTMEVEDNEGFQESPKKKKNKKAASNATNDNNPSKESNEPSSCGVQTVEPVEVAPSATSPAEQGTTTGSKKSNKKKGANERRSDDASRHQGAPDALKHQVAPEADAKSSLQSNNDSAINNDTVTMATSTSTIKNLSSNPGPVRRSADSESSMTPVEHQNKKQKKRDDPSKQISRLLHYLFEKGGLAVKQINIKPDGYVSVEDIVREYSDWTVEDIHRVVENSDFTSYMEDNEGHIWVKATAKQAVTTDTIDTSTESRSPDNGASRQNEGASRQTEGASRQNKGESRLTVRASRQNEGEPRQTEGASRQNEGTSRQNEGTSRQTEGVFRQTEGASRQNEGTSRQNEGGWEDSRKRRNYPSDRREDTNAMNRPASRPSDDFFLSKNMSFILRHGAAKVGLELHPDGYLYVEDLLRVQNLRHFTPQDVCRVVRDNDKQRFQITDTDGRLKVRANQGHTVEVPDLDLERVTDPATAPVVIHGTNLKAWTVIQSAGGLSTMGRNHIHFAVGEPGADGVISGMRNSSEVLIYINIGAALQDGIEFYRSANNVILSPGGQDGKLPIKYFEQVIQRQPRMKLM